MSELIESVQRHQSYDSQICLFGLVASLVDDGPVFVEGRVDFVICALAVLFGSAELVQVCG
jgi:hypothetical protein